MEIIELCKKAIFINKAEVKKVDMVEGKYFVRLNNGKNILVDPLFEEKLIKIETLGLSARGYNALINYGIFYLHQIPKTVKELLEIPAIGAKVAEEIYEKVRKM